MKNITNAINIFLRCVSHVLQCKNIHMLSNIKINFNFFYILFLLLFCSSGQNLFSQEIFESEGKDFWVTFLPNVHENSYQITDSLYIFITSEAPTKGAISYKYYNSKLNQWRDTVEKFNLTKSNEMFTWGTKYFDKTNNYSVELVGANYLRNKISTVGTDVSKIISNKSFHIQADDKITVYALQYATRSAEACIVLPVPALGKEYYVMSYNSDYGDFSSQIGSSSIVPTPSQFAIVATENNTSISINQSSKIVWQDITDQEPSNPHTINLNKGDVYLVQAYIDTKENIKSDLSGTHLVGNKPFAVFSGHVRATLPIEAVISGTTNNPSRDCLLEQMIPVHSWGENAIVTPFVVPIGIKNNTDPANLKYKDFFRVMSARDNTKIFINGNQIQSVLKAGEFIELELTEPALITSNKPIMTVQYKKTSEIKYMGNTRSTGDPLMLVVPPVEQFKKTYNVISPQMLGNSFTEQYLTIISSDSSINKIVLDGVLLPDSVFSVIPKSGFSFAQVKTKDGGHRITCEDPISVQVYGYGYAISYGYLGGMSFKDLEKDKIIYTTDSCYTSAKFTYNETFSSGIKSYEILDSTNCSIKIKNSSQKNLQLSISKKNIYEDAFFTIKIVDIYDEETIIKDTVLSYSIVVMGVEPEKNKTIDFGDCKIGTINKNTLQIINLSSFSVFVDERVIEFSNKKKFTISQKNLPALLAPKDTLKLDLYYSPTNSNIKDYDTLKISSLCDGTIVYLEGIAYSDTLDFMSKCDVPIRAISDSVDISTELPIIYPNPTDLLQITSYSFNVIEDSEVEIDIYSANGKLISTVLNRFLCAGKYEIELPINNLSSGTYIIKYKSSNKNKIQKLIIL